MGATFSIGFDCRVSWINTRSFRRYSRARVSDRIGLLHHHRQHHREPKNEVKCIVQTYSKSWFHRQTPQIVHCRESRPTVHGLPFLTHPSLPSKALAHQSRILHGIRAGTSRGEVELVGAVKPAGGPADVAEEDVGVLVQVGKLLAHVLLARVGVAAARLGEHGLAVVGAEPLGQGREGVVDVVGGAFRRGARVVALQFC